MIQLYLLTTAILHDHLTCGQVRDLYRSAECNVCHHGDQVVSDRWPSRSPTVADNFSIPMHTLLTCGQLEALALSPSCEDIHSSAGVIAATYTRGKRLSMLDVRPTYYQDILQRMYPENMSTFLNPAYDALEQKIDNTFSFISEECTGDRGIVYLAPGIFAPL